jgi:hypothetical protein
MSKTLNNQQRKVLSKLYEKQFSIKKQELREKRSKQFTQLQEKLNSKLKDKDFNEYVKAAETVKRLEKVLKDRYDNGEIEFSTASYGSAPRLSYKTSSYNGKVNPVLEAFNAETNSVMERVEVAEQEAQTRIYGLDVTFEEIQQEVDKLLKKL